MKQKIYLVHNKEFSKIPETPETTRMIKMNGLTS